MFDIYQIRLTDEQYDMVNEQGADSVPAYQLKRDMGFGPDLHGKHLNEMAAEGWAKNYFTKVATFDCDDVRQVFQIGNIGPEDCITRHARMHSVSVGDVVVNPDNGVAWVVDNYGYTLFDTSSSAI